MNLRGSRRRSVTNRDDRGAVFVEFALLIPVLLIFAMGIVEYGMAWKATNDVNSAARDGARSGTSAPAYLTADRTILHSIGMNLEASNQVDGIEKVIVFAASSADGKVPSNCLSLSNGSGGPSSPGGSSGVLNTCNVYGKGQIQYLLTGTNNSNDAPWVNSSGTGCSGSNIDNHWCPAKRNHTLSSDSFDYLGVYIKFKHKSVTNFGFGDQTIERTAVFRLEPNFQES